MTFSEKLDRAKIGSKAAYESLCLTCIDSLYAAALIALKNESAARSAVIAATNDGFAGISRIKDEKHLRSWLVHELTKNIVDKLKEFKAGGIVNEATGVFAETERLPDVERLVYSVAAAFDYGIREISVLTGMSEEAVSEKLFSAKAHLGAYYEEISAAAKTCEAPAALKDRYKTFDETIARLEATSAFPVSVPEELTSEDEEAPEPEEMPAEEPENTEEPVSTEEEEPAAVEQHETAPAAEEIPETQEEQPQPVQEELPESPDSDMSGEENVFADESSVSEAVPDEESAVEDFPEDGDEEDSPLPLNAATFIAVVSAEKMKGSEFLRLIGNTRISNSVYREIEQNPRLTKKRLIQLLEESPLTETDYYKLLTAVKHRREVLTAKAELQAVHERAGLFSGTPKARPPRRRRREEPKTELQMAIEMDLPKKETPPLTIDPQKKKDEPRIPPVPEKHERHHHSSEKKPKDDLGSLVSEFTESVPEDDNESFHPAEMSGIFNSIRDLEAVDPIAVIYANETGKQAKPGKINEQKSEWNKKADELRSAESEPVPTDGTQEFTVEPPAPAEISDTRTLNMPFPKLAEEEKQLTFSEYDEPETPEEEPSEQSVDEPEPPAEEPPAEDPAPVEIPLPEPDEDEEPDIITHKAPSDFSLTQIIGDYAGIAPKDGSMSVEEAIGETDELAGFAPDVHIPDEPEDEEPEPPAVPEETLPEPPQETDDEPYTPDADEKPYTPDIDEKTHVPDIADSVPFESDKPAKKNDPIARAAETEVTGLTAPLHISVPIDGMDGFGDDDDEDDEPDEDIDDLGDTTELKVPDEPAKPVVRPEKTEKPANTPEPVRETEYEETEEADEPDIDDNDDAPTRERYKGNEYFVDDDEYVEGINNGKLIFCAVCAVLLLAGAIVMKLALPKSDNGSGSTVSVSTGEDSGAAQTDAPAVSVPVESKDILTKLSSYEDIASAGTALSLAPQEAQYLSASAAPYESFLSRNFLTTASTAYIYNEGTIRTVSLDPAAPVDLGTAVLAQRGNAEFIGFTVLDGTIYAVTQANNTVYVDMSGGNYTSTETWSVTGTFVEMGLLGGKPVIVTRAPVDGTNAPRSSAQAAPAAEDIVRLNGAEYAGFTVIAEVGGSGLLDILGGCSTYAKFGDDKLTILAEDNNATYAVDITPALEAENARRYAGAAFSADCLNGDSFIGSNETKTGTTGARQYSGIAAVKGSNAVGTGVEGERPYAVAWQDENTACVLASRSDGTTVLYGFDMSGDTPAAAQITDSSVYSDKLISVGDSLIGLRVEASANGERVGLKLSEYSYTDKLNVDSEVSVGLDANAPAENLKYLQSPAEDAPEFIAQSEDGKLLALPTKYFDGFSEVERIVTFTNDGTLRTAGELLLYDEKSAYLCAAIRQGTLFVITDSKIMTANAPDCSGMKVAESVSAALAVAE